MIVTISSLITRGLFIFRPKNYASKKGLAFRTHNRHIHTSLNDDDDETLC